MRAAAALLVLLAAGCGGGAKTVPSGDVSDELALARSVRPALYWAGTQVAGLELTAISRAETPRATFFYGTCELPRGEGGCSPPVQIQHFPFVEAQWRRASGCRAVGELRSVPAAIHDGLVLFTGRRVVKVYARTRAEERRIARALRPLTGGGPGEPLPRPPADVRSLVGRVCR